MENAQKKVPINEGKDVVSSADLMKRIRQDIEAAVREGRSAVSKYYPLKPKSSPHEYPPLSSAEELRNINVLFQELCVDPKFHSHRPLVGKLITKFKRKLFYFVKNAFLADYLRNELKFNEQIVRYLNLSAQTFDFKLGGLFTELIRKIDVDIQGTNERTERLFSSLDSTIRTIESQMANRAGAAQTEIGAVRASVSVVASELKTVDSVARGLERTLGVLAKSDVSDSATLSKEPLNVDYLLLENRFRGSEEEITHSVRDYVPLLKTSQATILDIGCGRGELLEVLREENIQAKGIDLDRAMVLRCKEKGLDVELKDLFDYLAESKDGSFGAIIATQVVEHLTQPQLDKFISLANAKLISGGMLILETINPQSVTALARNFFRDPTHTFPVHPETLKFALEMKGFQTDPILYRSPYPKDAMLSKIDYSSELPARWLALLDQLNDNFTRLNDLLFGYQDFAVVGRKSTNG